MNREDLLALIEASFSYQREPALGGFLFCHTPYKGEFAYLGRVYDPASPQRARTWAAQVPSTENLYFGFLTATANGLTVANLSLYGIVEQVNRSVGAGMVGQPISLDYGNIVERPSGLAMSDMVIGGIVGWSSRGLFVTNSDGAVRLVHHLDGDDVAAEWPSLENMLRSELSRIASGFDPNGRMVSTSTDLMHPNGRRWETTIEPASVRH